MAYNDLSILNREQTKISGSAVGYATPLYDFTDELAGSRSATHSFFQRRQGTAPFVNTNMKANGQIANGRAFDVAGIGLRVSNRGLLTNGTTTPAIAANTYADTIRTLFSYGVLTFKLDGTDTLGDIPLSYFLPPLAQEGDAGINATGGTSEPHIFPLGKDIIPLDAMTNFSVDLTIDIPQSVWTPAGGTAGAATHSWEALAITDPRSFVPEYTRIGVLLLGKAYFAQR